MNIFYQHLPYTRVQPLLLALGGWLKKKVKSDLQSKWEKNKHMSGKLHTTFCIIFLN